MLQLSMSEAERALMSELLQLELRELPVEIRHAVGRETRGELHHRLEAVQALLKRLEQSTPAAV